MPDTRARWWQYLYMADHKAGSRRLKAVAWWLGTPGLPSPLPPPPPLVLRLFRAASNHHESPFRIGAEPRGTTDARGRFSSGCWQIFLDRQSDWTVSDRCSLHAAHGSALRIYFRWKDNSHSSRILSATDRFSTGESDLLHYPLSSIALLPFICIYHARFIYFITIVGMRIEYIEHSVQSLA